MQGKLGLLAGERGFELERVINMFTNYCIKTTINDAPLFRELEPVVKRIKRFF